MFRFACAASYVVWISVIPVIFSASAGLTLNADWGWSICDSDLSAMIGTQGRPIQQLLYNNKAISQQCHFFFVA